MLRCCQFDCIYKLDINYFWEWLPSVQLRLQTFAERVPPLTCAITSPPKLVVSVQHHEGPGSLVANQSVAECTKKKKKKSVVKSPSTPWPFSAPSMGTTAMANSAVHVPRPQLTTGQSRKSESQSLNGFLTWIHRNVRVSKWVLAPASIWKSQVMVSLSL